MEKLIQEYIGISPGVQEQILFTVIVLLIGWLVVKLLDKFILNKIEDLTVRYSWKKFVKYFTAALVIIFLSRIWFGVFESIGTFLGLLSAGLAIAFKDLLVNLVGWVFIIIRKPLKVGDRIQIGEIKGDVIDTRLFQFSIIEIGNWVDSDQSTGRIIHIPNGMIFTKWQANYTAGFEYIWNEIPVLVTFEGDWKKAKKILTVIVNKHTIQLTKDAENQIKNAAKKFMIFYDKLTPIVYTSVKDSGVLLTLRYLCYARSRRSTEEAIWETVLDEFSNYDDIDFAYPTRRLYNNIIEGKINARADIISENKK